MTLPATASTETPRARRIIVAITGASGAIYGVRLLQVLQGMGESAGVESHLLMSPAGLMNVQHELHTRVENHAAIRFYGRAGWAVTDRVIHTVEHGISYDERVLVKHVP